ncbi:MAG: hypothetical protein Q8Q03_02280 [bacterium]|nr:hypothetical protein [bacterium]
MKEFGYERRTMKKIFLAVVGLVALILTGCGTPAQYYRSPLDPILQSSIPGDPVRNSSSFLQVGGYTYSHNQGTHNHVSRIWSRRGVREDVVQDTYRNTYINVTPPLEYHPELIDAPFTYPQFSGSVGGGVFSGRSGGVFQ